MLFFKPKLCVFGVSGVEGEFLRCTPLCPGERRPEELRPAGLRPPEGEGFRGREAPLRPLDTDRLLLFRRPMANM